MKQFKTTLIFLVVGLIFYFFWQNKFDSKNPTLPPKESEKIDVPVKANTLLQAPKEKSGKVEDSREIEIKDYITKLNKTIKTQYKEIEECEKEFDVHFGDLLEMSEKKQLEYISDPNNLEALLDKFSSINFTTPSSAKVIKEFADPISEQVKITDVYHKPGLQDRVEICSARGKKDIIELLFKSKIKKKAILRALIDFFENENATLDYPWILYNQIIELKNLLKFQGIPESKFLDLGEIEKDFKEFDKKISNLLNQTPPRESATFNLEEAKFQYEFARKLQAEIKSLLQQIKEIQ